ncbi:MAG: hypothetical protein HZB30_00125 [Nitrospirae bacterium]|nr:hypothetical protein [Nitrospirota bacterium]
MFTFFKSVLVLGAILSLLIGCTAYRQQQEWEHAKVLSIMKDNVTVKPSGSSEECFALKKGQTLVYKFKAARPLDFNIHYHGKDQVHYPVSKSEITEDDGIIDPARHHFYTEDQEYYCLMWENPGMRPVHISYECEVRKK